MHRLLEGAVRGGRDHPEAAPHLRARAGEAVARDGHAGAPRGGGDGRDERRRDRGEECGEGRARDGPVVTVHGQSEAVRPGEQRRGAARRLVRGQPHGWGERFAEPAGQQGRLADVAPLRGGFRVGVCGFLGLGFRGSLGIGIWGFTVSGFGFRVSIFRSFRVQILRFVLRFSCSVLHNFVFLVSCFLFSVFSFRGSGFGQTCKFME